MRVSVLLLSCMLAANALACDLKVESAWIRTAPANARSLAGYALLSNTGSTAVSIASAQSTAFEQVQMYQSFTEKGIAKMRELDKLELPPGKQVTFAPGGRHFMLIGPKAVLKAGDVVTIKIKDSHRCETSMQFTLRNDAVGTNSMEHGKMDHAEMDMSKMDHVRAPQ